MDINKTFERIIALYDSGGDPNQMLKQMYSNHPNINQMNTQLNNMAQGRTKPELYMQIAKQVGLNDKNIQGLARILGINNTH